MPTSVALYEPFRVVGLVSDDIPFVLQKLGDETFLYTVVGNCFQVFKTDRLVVCLVSRPAPGKINAIQVSFCSCFYELDGYLALFLSG
jgi:U3 small nucleolar RNA-associated protein 21